MDRAVNETLFEEQERHRIGESTYFDELLYQHRCTLLEDSVQRSWTATFFRIFVFFLYPEKYGGSKTVLKSEIGLVDHIQKK